MRVTSLSTLVLVAVLAATGFPASAHHGGAVEYDATNITGPLTGTVTRFALNYPHPAVYFDVKNSDGTVAKWAAMLRPTPAILRNHGWTRESIKPGDTITITMWTHRSVERLGNAVRITVNGMLLAESVTALN
jgi:Family of unknown function (DUF6152)